MTFGHWIATAVEANFCAFCTFFFVCNHCNSFWIYRCLWWWGDHPFVRYFERLLVDHWIVINDWDCCCWGVWDCCWMTWDFFFSRLSPFFCMLAVVWDRERLVCLDSIWSATLWCRGMAWHGMPQICRHDPLGMAWHMPWSVCLSVCLCVCPCVDVQTVAVTNNTVRSEKFREKRVIMRRVAAAETSAIRYWSLNAKKKIPAAHSARQGRDPEGTPREPRPT